LIRAQWALEENNGHASHKVRAEVRKIAGRWLGDVERRLEDREWIACVDFTVVPTRNTRCL